MTRSTFSNALSSLLILLFYACLQTTVYACNATVDTRPLVIGIAGDQFIAIYNTSGTVCVFQQPASGVSASKAYLGKSGKELKKVWPELDLPTVYSGVIVTDLKNGHNILFQTASRPRPVTSAQLKSGFQVLQNAHSGLKQDNQTEAKKGNLEAGANLSLGNDSASGNIVFDLDKKKVVSKNANPEIDAHPSVVSTQVPMAMYTAYIGGNMSKNRVFNFKGDSLANATTEPIAMYSICPGPDESPSSPSTLSSFKLGSEPRHQMVVTKQDTTCKNGHLKGVPEEVTGASGFVGGKSFHLLLNGGKVVSFEKEALFGKLGKPVPYTVVDAKDFLIQNDTHGGGGDDNGGGGGKSGGKVSGSIWLVIILIVVVILLIIAAVAVFCCCSSSKKSGRGSKGGGSKSRKRKSSKKSKKSKLKSKLRSSRKSRKSNKSLGSKKSSKKGATSRLSSRGKSKRSSKSHKVSSRKSGKASSKKSSKH